MKVIVSHLNKYSGRRKPGLVLGVLFLALCLVGCVKQIHFSSGDAATDATEISIALQPGETALLDGFTGLQAADLSGSTDLAEVTAWAASHPETAVTYTVPFPCDILAESSVTSLDLSALSSAELTDETLSQLSYLPSLQAIMLDGTRVTVQDVLRIHNQFPSLKINCTLSVGSCELNLTAASLNLTSITHSDVAEICSILPLLTQCKTIDLGSRPVEENADTITWEDIRSLEQAAPDAAFSYSFTLYEKEFTLNSTEMDLNHITIDDQGELVRRVIRCMPSLTLLGMDFCGVDDEHMAAIRDEFPSVEVIWRIWFGRVYTCRTDAEKILASDDGLGYLTVDNTQSLKYCTKIKYLDIGHNEPLTDISFVRYMPDLEVLIIAYDHVTSLEDLTYCPKLEYLEFFNGYISDLTPLSGLTGLHHLNICDNYTITDISPLYTLTNLERLWIGCNTAANIPAEQIEKMQSIVPDCQINTTVVIPSDAWRWGSERYPLLVEQFGYNTGDFTTIWNDPKYFAEGQPHVWW